MQPGWDYFVGYGTYMFYDRNKFDALEGGVKTVSCSGTRGGSRAANWMVLRQKSSRKVFIVGGIHLSYCSGGCDWVHECELGQMYDSFYDMKSKYQGAPVVWMGDINRGTGDRITRNILAGRVGDRQVFSVEDLAQTTSQTYYAGGVIDFIFGESSAFSRVAGGGTGQGVRGQWLNGADHHPVYATIER